MWTDIEEQAVSDFIKSDSVDERNKIYNTILDKLFKELIVSVFKKYNNNYLNKFIENEDNILDVLSYVFTVIHKFDPDHTLNNGNKIKAYTYFKVIITSYIGDINYKKRKLTYE